MVLSLLAFATAVFTLCLRIYDAWEKWRARTAVRVTPIDPHEREAVALERIALASEIISTHINEGR